jgi:hypothetical protein
MSDGPTQRKLIKQVGATNLGFNYDSLTDAYATNGWSVVWNTAPYVINRTYVDLAGYTLQDLTTFIQGVDFQVETLIRSLSTGIPEVTWLDILSTRRLSDAELSNWAIPGVTGDVPGFLDSTVDLQEVIYGERTTLAQNSNIPSLVGAKYVVLDRETFGSGNASAADRLHWSRVYWFNGSGPNEVIMIPAANLVSQAVTVKEKDLIYIERLRRAYTQDPGRNV